MRDENRKLSLAQNAVLNSAGSIFYYFCQWLLTILIVRITGSYEDTGIFQLAISITNVFQIIACFVPRTFQISDRGEYSAGIYIGLRLLTSALALVLCILYAAVLRYDGTVLTCIALYMVLKVSESVSDVLRTFAQIRSRMDCEFVSYVVRGLAGTLVFTAVLYWKRDLRWAMLGMAAVSCVLVGLLDVYYAGKFVPVRPESDLPKYGDMVRRCFPVIITTVLITAFATVPRQMLERTYGTEMMGYYGAVSSPIAVVQLLARSLLMPLLSRLSDDLERSDTKRVRKTVWTVLASLCLLWLIASAGARLLGEPVYVLIYGEPIREYCYTMYPLIACSVACVAGMFVTDLITVMRRQVQGMYASLLASVLLLLCAPALIRAFGLNGASWAMLTGYGAVLAAGLRIVIRELKRTEAGLHGRQEENYQGGNHD